MMQVIMSLSSPESVEVNGADSATIVLRRSRPHPLSRGLGAGMPGTRLGVTTQ